MMNVDEKEVWLANAKQNGPYVPFEEYRKVIDALIIARDRLLECDELKMARYLTGIIEGK